MATATAPPPGKSGGPAGDSDPTDLHGLAVDCAQDLSKFATALAHAGAAPQAVQTVTQMAGQLNEVVKVLGSAGGPGGPPGGPGGPPPGAEGPPPGAGPPPGPGGPPPGGPPGPGGPPPPGGPEEAPPGVPAKAAPSFHAAAAGLHAAMVASAQAKKQP